MIISLYREADLRLLQVGESSNRRLLLMYACEKEAEAQKF
jgi:hypothetical protein